MIIEIFGKKNCPLCESAKKKIGLCLSKLDMTESVPVVFHDIETVDGAAEGDFHDVFEIPSVLLKHPATGAIMARWDGKAPPSQELQARLCA